MNSVDQYTLLGSLLLLALVLVPQGLLVAGPLVRRRWFGAGGVRVLRADLRRQARDTESRGNHYGANGDGLARSQGARSLLKVPGHLRMTRANRLARSQRTSNW